MAKKMKERNPQARCKIAKSTAFPLSKELGHTLSVDGLKIFFPRTLLWLVNIAASAQLPITRSSLWISVMAEEAGEQSILDRRLSILSR
jgi:hypothetical protein